MIILHLPSLFSFLFLRDISFLYDAVSNKNTSSSSKREDEKRKNDKVKVSPQTFSQEANDKQQHEYEASKNTKEVLF